MGRLMKHTQSVKNIHIIIVEANQTDIPVIVQQDALFGVQSKIVNIPL